MIRILGFLCGVAVTAAGFLLVLDSADLRRIKAAMPSAMAHILPQRGDSFGSPVEAQSEASPNTEGLASHAYSVAPQPVQGPPSREEGQATTPEGLAEDPASAVPLQARTIQEPASGDERQAITPTGLIAAPVSAAPLQAQTMQEPVSGDEGQATNPEGLAPAPASGAQTPTTTAQASGEVEPQPPPSPDAHSHLFWSPFRSKLGAQGFADRLSSATDVAVVVVEGGPASYRVGFGYRDEAERRARIERIETITGLELE